MVIHRAEERGKAEHGWLSARHSFSFANWYNADRMGFGALRVLNDDRIAPGAGFPPHAHSDMEIITIVTSGAVAHKDSTGSEGVVHAGEVQVMSAGTGVIHSEYNASETEPLTLFQIWIETATPKALPRYAERAFSHAEKTMLLVAPLGSPEVSFGNALGIHQRAYVTRVRLATEKTYSYTIHDIQNGMYIFVVEGMIAIEKEELSVRDAVGITDTNQCDIFAQRVSELLIIEVPVAA